MSKGYWVASVTITNPEAYPAYLAANGRAFEKYGAKFLARGGRYQALEGAIGTRNIIIEFESYEQALACYNSPEYQDALKIRQSSSTANIVVIEGVP